MSKNFVWNENDAEQVRYESEQALREQINNMQTTAQVYRGWLPGMDAHAREQEHIAATAMRTVSIRNGGTRQVPDWPRRAEAARRAAFLREQISLATRAANAIDRSVADLENVIITTNHQFRNMRNTAQSIDFRFASAVHAIEDDIYAYNKDMEYLYDSFSEDGFDQNCIVSQIRDLSKSLALKGLDAFGDHILNLLRRGGFVGQALSARFQSVSVLGNYPNAQRTIGNALRAIPDGAWRIAGYGLRAASNVASVVINSVLHYREHRDVGRAVSYGLFVGGGVLLATLAVKAWPVVAVIGVGVIVGTALVAAYEHIPPVRLFVDSFGDSLSALNWSSQGGNLESEFWTPEVLSFYNGQVGNAVSSSDWVTCIWEGRCGN